MHARKTLAVLSMLSYIQDILELCRKVAPNFVWEPDWRSVVNVLCTARTGFVS